MCLSFKHKCSFDNLEYLAGGKSSTLYGIGNERVLKVYNDPSDGEIIIEQQAYERLGSHSNIAKYLGSPTEGAILLQRGRVLRDVCRQQGADQISLRMKLRWLKDFANGLQHMHEKGIVHCDVGCHNAILVHNRLKIIDFEGCSIDGAEASAPHCRVLEYSNAAPSSHPVDRG